MMAGFDLLAAGVRLVRVPASSLDLLVGRVTFIDFPCVPFVPVVEVVIEVQQAGRPRHITMKRQPQMKLRLQRANNTTVVCNILEGLLKTEGEVWLQAVESRTAPGVGWRKPHVSCQGPRVT